MFIFVHLIVTSEVDKISLCKKVTTYWMIYNFEPPPITIVDYGLACELI